MKKAAVLATLFIATNFNVFAQENQATDSDYNSSTNNPLEQILVYLNASEDILNIELPVAEDNLIKTYKIFDDLGSVVIEKQTTKNQLNVALLSTGYYSISIKIGEEEAREEFVKSL